MSQQLIAAFTQVDSWTSFEAVKQALCKGSFIETRAQHRLENSSGKPIDIVPFGENVQNNNTIAWPPDGDVVMNVMGFQEACDNAQSVIVREAPLPCMPSGNTRRFRHSQANLLARST